MQFFLTTRVRIVYEFFKSIPIGTAISGKPIGKMKKTITMMALAALALASVNAEAKPIPQPKTGTLIVYRTWNLRAAAWSLPFYVNGQLGAKLTNGYYYKLELPEGDYVLTHPGYNDPQRVHVSAGQTVYFCNSLTMISYVFEVTEDQNDAREIASHLKQQTTQK
jgi:hypothetical protein